MNAMPMNINSNIPAPISVFENADGSKVYLYKSAEECKAAVRALLANMLKDGEK